ncbi:MAG: DUF6348 family protein [Candidatus Hermodarchaeota archaeon]
MNIFLKEIFEEHGIQTQIQNDWLIFQNKNIKINGEIVSETKYENFFSVQLDVRLQIDPNKTIIESFGGIGQDKDEAILSAQQNFAVNSFHVFLAAFFDPNDDHVTKEIWSIRGKKKRVIIGNIGIRGEIPTENNVHVSWFEKFEKKIQMENLEQGIHWIRLYFAQMNNEQLECEVLLDNAHWEKMQKEMAAIDWPKSNNFFSVRIFIIIQEIESG